jgi:hypothetical protein
MRLCSVALLTGLAAAPAVAQPIETDRPDFTEGTSAVAFRRLQVEAGTTLAREPGVGTVWSGPEVLVRVGLGSGFEARLALPDLVGTAPFTPEADRSLADALVGFKAELGRAAGLDAAVIVELHLDASGLYGSSPGPSSGPSPRALFVVGRDVSPTFSVGGQVEATYDRGAGRVLGGGTLVGGLGLGPRVGTFAEVAVSAVPDGPLAAVLHHGYTLALTEALQLDAHAGVGLTATAPDVFVGAGVGVRF